MSLQIVNGLVNVLALSVGEMATVDEWAGHLPPLYPLWLSLRKMKCASFKKKEKNLDLHTILIICFLKSDMPKH